MVVRRILPFKSTCWGCRHAVLADFASVAGISIRAGSRPAPIIPVSKKIFLSRGFKAFNLRLSDVNLQETVEDNPTKEKDAVGVQAAAVEKTASTTIPWYLQLDTPQEMTNPLLERQRLPDLPPSPPPLLQTFLKHISVDLGLDELCLLDLRNLNPPPALGANLLMILGTARSEKHLHVSADRFCKWLRSVHKLSPYADGLIGRGELKTRLKRKARRAKLFSSVGSSDRSGADDELRTGWVCVNVGNIEDAQSSKQIISEPENFVGFREEIGGTNLVVQMLTQEKREDLDLEGLWTDVLSRQEIKEVKDSTAPEQPTTDLEVRRNSIQEGQALSNPSPTLSFSHEKLPNYKLEQVRAFHSQNRSYQSISNIQGNLEHHSPDLLAVQPGILLGNEKRPVIQEPTTYTPADEDVRNVLKQRTGRLHNTKNDAQSLAAASQYLTLRMHLRYLLSLSQNAALAALGTGFKDFSSTSFLGSFYKSFPLFADERHWECRWNLVQYAIKIGHPGYRNKHLLSLFSQIQASLVRIPLKIYEQAFQAILQQGPSPQSQLSGSTGKCSSIQAQNIRTALQLLEELQFRGYNIYRKGILTALRVALASACNSRINHQKQLRPDADQRLIRRMDRFGYVSMELEAHMRILNAYADQDNWTGFWQHWRGFATRMQPKPKELYDLMFRRVALTGRQASCISALRAWVMEMEQEEPPVPFAEVAGAVMGCLKVVEPGIEQDSSNGQYGNGEWIKMWRRCKTSIQNNLEYS